MDTYSNGRTPVDEGWARSGDVYPYNAHSQETTPMPTRRDSNP